MVDHRADWNYPFDSSLIATAPPASRTASRLMHLNAAGDAPRHLGILDLPSLLNAGDVLILNNTKVVPARLRTHKESGGAVEVLVLGWDGKRARAMTRSSKALRPGHVLRIQDGPSLTVEGPAGEEHQWIVFPSDVEPILEQFGEIPLPPYMERAPNVEDRQRYQTVYAQHAGSSAAPTAGLHLDDALLRTLKAGGVEVVQVTLHVGPGTFQPIRVDDVDAHPMHSEQYDVPSPTVQAILKAKARGSRVFGVGTTSVRAVESAAQDGTLGASMGDTRLFIRPGFQFRVVDGMLTNFHLPESTLLMLVAAMVGKDRILNAYALAQQERYRFFSYGDAMFLERPAAVKVG